jgi:acyl-CoA synthetase (NDP forming)/RimJ/RimL family protein N-acetyltransferase
MDTGARPRDVSDAAGSSAAAGWDALAADGSVVHLRPVRHDDEEALRQLHERVSDRSIYLRYFALNRELGSRQSHHMAEDSPADGHVVLVAEAGDRFVGVGSFEPLGDGEAEVAFLIDDAYHGRGLGTLLLEQLAALARERGIHHLRAETLVENAAMLKVFADSGFAQVRRIGDGVAELSLSTTYEPRTLDRIAERERSAEELSLAPLLAPQAVAVVGAGRRAGGIGHEVLVNLARGGFTGRLSAVNPHAGPGDRIADVDAYPSIADVPGRVDLAVIAVPADDVTSVVDQCGRAGVRGAVVLSSGFSETGVDGHAGQRELVRLARSHGMRLIGPNCLGIANTAPDVRLDATFANVRPEPGSLALAAQSGAVGIAVLDHASRVGPGISEFVSLGNKADVSGNDLLLHWWDDPRTDVIGLYLESFGNPRKFGRLARLVGRTKPVLVVKGGRSGGGRRAGASHTAAAATPDTAVDALFAQSGVLRMDTLEDLIDTARLLAEQPLPRGRRVAIVGNAGGAGVLAADAAEAAGLLVPELTDATANVLLDATGAVAAGNPTDLGAAATGERLATAVRVLLGSGEVDAVLVVFAATRAGNVDEVYAAVGRAASGATVPVLVNCLGAPTAPPRLQAPDGRRLPVYPFPETAIRALSRAVEYAEWRERPQGVVPDLDGVDEPAVRAIVDDYVADQPAGGWPPPQAAARLLAAVGVTVLPVVAAASDHEVTAAAARCGYPVALKTAAPDVVHKTDVGGVRLGLADRHTLVRAYDEMTETTGDPRVTVQPMAPNGVELVAGLNRDDLFGPVLMAGAGGVLTDLLADRQWRGLPLTDLDAADLVRSLRCAPLLAGYRGQPAADEGAVLDVLHRIARLAELAPEVAELDVNPLVAAPGGAFAVDVKVRLLPAPAIPDAYDRRLR